MEYIIDSYAWIEYFIGSAKGRILNKLFSSEKNMFFTVECCLAEIQGWALRENQGFDRLFKIIKANSDIIEIEQEDWVDAAKERFEQRKKQKDFGLIDAVILVKQKQLRCDVVSGDSHFKKLKGVVFMK